MQVFRKRRKSQGDRRIRILPVDGVPGQAGYVPCVFQERNIPLLQGLVPRLLRFLRRGADLLVGLRNPVRRARRVQREAEDDRC